ncbi:MAG TPA: hypothetical protein VK854_14545 [Woeseiaceae bacterium]|nr:hypothetical protein [Woeseiaceae bacterium]
MTRSPLFYPMHRGDTDAGGAADLQTDIMRFMAILALCLVAIFALVQSIPLAPEAPSQSPAPAAPPPMADAVEPAPEPPPDVQEPLPAPATPEKPVQLVRATWTPDAVPEQGPPPSAKPPENEGFTLRFESDLALTRLVAAGKVGLYAITDGRARRMTVSDSRISFWDASAPNSYHEMEAGTVPRPVIDALGRSGVNTAGVDWGVTLPGRLREQLDDILRGNSGGALVIGGDGELRLEAS